MASRAAKFISAIFAGALLGAPLAIMTETAPAAADDCLAGPKGAAPEGQHWYYRIERGTKRQCWYLREEGEKTSQGTAPTSTSVAQQPNAASRSLQDAFAEVPMPQQSPAQDASPSAPAATATAIVPESPPAAATDPNVQQPAPVTSRWPDPATATSAPAQPTPALAVAGARKKDPAATSSATSPVAPAATDLPSDKPTGTIPTLLLVVLGALALAGLIGSIIYRFAGASRDPLRTTAGQRRRVNWEAAGEADRAPWAEATPSYAPPAEFAMRPAPEREPNAPTAEPEQEAIDIDRITAMLERLAKEGPKLSAATATGSAAYEQTRPDRSGVRA